MAPAPDKQWRSQKNISRELNLVFDNEGVDGPEPGKHGGRKAQKRRDGVVFPITNAKPVQ